MKKCVTKGNKFLKKIQIYIVSVKMAPLKGTLE